MKIKRLETPPILPKTTECYQFGDCTVLVGKEPSVVNELVKMRWHLSITHPNRLPNWKEIKTARYHFIPDEICMAMVLPSKKDYINVHSNCLQLWEIDPDYAQM